MKTQSLKSLAILFTIFASTALSSCDDDSEKPSSGNDQDKRGKVEKVISFRQDLDFVNRFVDTDAIMSGSENGRVSLVRGTVSRIKESAPCTNATEEELPDGGLQVTLDFGDGCETEDGLEVAGKVVMIFHPTDFGIDFDLEFFDYAELEGDRAGEVVNGTAGGSFIIDLESSAFIQEMEQDLTITYPGNIEAVYKVSQRAELTETGLRVTELSTSGNLADGSTFAVTLNKTLVYDFSCEGDLPVQGEELLIFQGNTILVNYGSGSCDNQYVVK